MSSLRNAFITGASSGLGASLARELGRRGYRLGLAARRMDRLEALQEELKGSGVESFIYELDVMDTDAVTRVIREADKEMGSIGTVVANAGAARSRWAGKLSYEHVERVLRVNVLGTAATVTALLPKMVERGEGRVAAVSSIAGMRGLPRNAAYSSSKAQIITFMESLRVDLAGTGVTATDIRPGFVRTEMTADLDNTPFMMDAEPAGKVMADGLEKGKAVVCFPFPLNWAAPMLGFMPAWMYRAMSGSMTARKNPKD